MATRLIINLPAGTTVMVPQKSILTQVVGSADAADYLQLKWDKDAITTNSPVLISVAAPVATGAGFVVPMDLSIEGGTVIKNASAGEVALFFS